MSDHFFRLPRAVIELWRLYPIVAQIEPPRIRLLDKHSFPTAAPALQFLFAGDCVTHVAKVLNPNEPVQMIASGKAVRLAGPMLVQTPRNIIRDPNVQCGAMFVGWNVYPVVVIAHAGRNSQRCFASLNMTAD